jgi:hypothetical protein
MAATPTAQLLVRKDIFELNQGNAWDPVTTAYANAVGEMRRRSPDDPTSWSYQSAIHGSYQRPPKDDWNMCQHATWFFLPWHRMYIYGFEAIVRQIVIKQGGPSDWALPFWDWTKNPGLPRAFMQRKMPDGTTDNPLFTDHRSAAMNRGGTLPPAVVSTDYAFSFRAFDSGVKRSPLTGQLDTGFGGGKTPAVHFGNAAGALEDQPHNIIHDLVGGGGSPTPDCNAGWMSDPNCAASDPIFWLHHSNIDRLWVKWLALGGTRVDPTDASWLNQRFKFFHPDKSAFFLQVWNVVSTRQLGYRYSTDPLPVAQPLTQPERAVAPPEPPPDVDAQPEPAPSADPPVLGEQTGVTINGSPSTVELALAPEAGDRVQNVAQAPPTEVPPVYLMVDDLEVDKHPGVVYSVYLNLPDADESTDHYSEHLAGFLTFFGVPQSEAHHGDDAGGGHEHGPAARKYDITGIVRSQQAEGTWDASKATLTFVPTGVQEAEGGGGAATDAEVRLGRVRLVGG